MVNLFKVYEDVKFLNYLWFMSYKLILKFIIRWWCKFIGKEIYKIIENWVSNYKF